MTPRAAHQAAAAESAGDSAVLPDDAVQADTRKAWRAWLTRHHAQAEGIWLVMWKKASGRARLSYAEAVEEALCFGWIDSRPNTLDGDRSLLRFAPRKAGTGWSRLNKQRVEQAMADGRMATAGRAKVDAAKADGSWSALDAVEALEIPPDLREALHARGPAAANFEAFPRSVKRSILEWIGSAKRAATRAERIKTSADMAALNQRANQWRQ